MDFEGSQAHVNGNTSLEQATSASIGRENVGVRSDGPKEWHTRLARD